MTEVDLITQAIQDRFHTWFYVEKVLGEIRIEVRGDWKHEHLAMRRLMEELGYRFLGDDIFEDDGTDYYTSLHYYRKEA